MLLNTNEIMSNSLPTNLEECYFFLYDDPESKHLTEDLKEKTLPLMSQLQYCLLDRAGHIMVWVLIWFTENEACWLTFKSISGRLRSVKSVKIKSAYYNGNTTDIP